MCDAVASDTVLRADRRRGALGLGEPVGLTAMRDAIASDTSSAPAALRAAFTASDTQMREAVS